MTCVLLVFFHVPLCCRCFHHIAAGWLAFRLIPFVLAIIACCLSWKAVARGLMTQWHCQNWYLIAFCFSRTVHCNMHAVCSCLFTPLITYLNREHFPFVCMENLEIPGKIQIKQFIQVETFQKKSITFLTENFHWNFRTNGKRSGFQPVWC